MSDEEAKEAARLYMIELRAKLEAMKAASKRCRHCDGTGIEPKATLDLTRLDPTE